MSPPPGTLYDGDGMRLSGAGPPEFTVVMAQGLAFRAILQADPDDPHGELRLGDWLWLVPPFLAIEKAGGLLAELAALIRAGASGSWPRMPRPESGPGTRWC